MASARSAGVARRKADLDGDGDARRSVSMTTEAPAHGPAARRSLRPRPTHASRPTPIAPVPANGADVIAGVRITHPERVVYPEAGITKLEIVQYYARMAPLILPFVRNRPLSIVRCREGPKGTCFFQKHATGRDIPGISYALITERLGEKPYVVANTTQALAGLAQMSTLELHGWNATADDVERADMLVFDFDPDPDIAFRDVAAAAVQCRTVLSAFGLESFCKTTGGKGLHVVVPLARRVPWEPVKTFARGIAELMARQWPGQFVTKAGKTAREGRIFIDYLRNARGATAVVPWSLRARTGAPIAVPLYWNEVNASLVPAAFNLRTIEARLAPGGDPWAGYRTTRQTLTVEMQRQLQRA